MQWLDTTSATVWIWDGAQWLQFPPGGAGYDDDEIRQMIADNAAAVSDNASEIQTNRGYINTNISNIAQNASEHSQEARREHHLDRDTGRVRRPDP